MSKLEKLIQELCPNGVEYKRLGDIAIDIYRGSGIRRDEVTENGIPCVRYGEIYTTYGVWFDKCVSHTVLENVSSPKYFGHGDILFAITGESVEDIAKSTVYVGKEKCLAGGDIVIMKHKQVPKYMAYALSTYDAQKQKSAGKIKSKVVHSSVPAIKDIVVPVPPLEVQREIVRVLDHFTLLSTDLTAELTARKKQYEFYRKKLLSFGLEKVEATRLGDVCSMKAGKAINASMLSDEKTDSHQYECYGGNGVRGYIEKYSHSGEYPIIGRQGALCGNVNYAQGDFYATEHAVVVDGQGKVSQRYLFYMLTAMNLNQYKSQGAQPGLAVNKLENLQVKIPSQEVQNKIVRVLDNFDTICSDLNIGLPAEIDARQKQYEYYRDKLLSF